MTRIAKGIQQVERWDKIVLENGIVGYMYQPYVSETPPIKKVTGIKLDETELHIQIETTSKINVSIEPENAYNKNIIYRSSNTDIARVDENGVITAKQLGECIITVCAEENQNIKQECKVNVVRKIQDSEISFNSPLSVNDLEISGIDYNKNTVKDLKELIITNLEISIIDNKGKVLENDDILGTGAKIQVKENGKILRQYTIIIYGDVNGDAKINSTDLLVLQRHILELENIEGVYLKAGNVRRVGTNPTSIDLLLIQRHILDLKKLPVGTVLVGNFLPLGTVLPDKFEINEKGIL